MLRFACQGLHLELAGFIAWYLEKVLPSQWGPRLPWWFILSKTWWCETVPAYLVARLNFVSCQYSVYSSNLSPFQDCRTAM